MGPEEKRPSFNKSRIIGHSGILFSREAAAAQEPAREAHMPAVITEDVLSSVAWRWGQIDRLLPVPKLPAEAGCSAELIVAEADGRPTAVGWCRHRFFEPDAAELAWGAAAAQFWLTPYVAGDAAEPGIGSALYALLSGWGAHLAADQATEGEDSQATIRWPSRDTGGVRALLRHGLQPLTVIAARPAGRPLPATVPAPDDLRIRRAGPGDVADVTALTLDVIRFDQHFGSALVRPHAERAHRREAEQTLATPQPWTWLAERAGQAIGLLVAQPPDQAGWIAPSTSQRPVAYLSTMSVQPDDRGTGVGTALVAELHRELDAAGVAVTLLHHALLNPLSTPFWSRMGYRPLWTTFEIRPARALR
jgi:GNAT superfamily N-acetyltransferase